MDIEVFEVKILLSSKCKWRHCRLLKACNDWRHCRLRHVDEDIVAFEGMQWMKTLSSSKCKWGSLLPLKACNDWRHFCLWNVCGLPYRASPHATWLLTGRGSRTVCLRITTWGISACHLTSRVRINRSCLCTNNHSGIFACHRTRHLWIAKVQKTKLVSACQRAHLPLVDKGCRWRR